jgi:UDP-N-acetylglucosamine 2-epimerase
VGDIMRKTEEVVIKEQPDAMLVLGDTNSCLAAYMAKRKHIPVFHMEAGNRCFDFNVPEEINRRVIDHLADFNLVYTEHARHNLLAEGLSPRRIYLTGSPLREVLNHYLPKINKSDALKRLSLTSKNYFLISIHREENVDNRMNLRQIIQVLNALAERYEMPVIVATHPRTRKRLETANTMALDKRIQWLKPFGFLDYVQLQMHARCVVSDSGSISEESAMLSFPAVSLRSSIERPEAQDAGTIVLTGLDPETAIDCIRMVVDQFSLHSAYEGIAGDYAIANTSWRVLKLIAGLTRLSNRWHGIND